MRDEEISNEIAPLVEAIMRWYQAYSSITKMRDGDKPDIRHEVLDFVMRAEKLERYYRRHWGPHAGGRDART
jgi:hypothetical protein